MNNRKCIDCLYFLLKNIKEESVCLKFGKQKEWIFETAENCRKEQTKCGKDGKYLFLKMKLTLN
jgi:hypothetical protein